MKLIVAYIQPERLNAVKQALYEKEVYKMSVTNALGCGEEKGYLLRKIIGLIIKGKGNEGLAGFLTRFNRFGDGLIAFSICCVQRKGNWQLFL